MKTREVINASLRSARSITKMLLGDLSDADLMVRPVDGANHIAWQLGHLIAAEKHFVEGIRAGSMPELPAGFNDRHSKQQSANNDPSNFMGKAGYLDLWDNIRQATLRVVDGISDDELDFPSPEAMRPYAPTIGALLILTAHHELMHAGQYTIVRRKLGKPHVV